MHKTMGTGDKEKMERSHWWTQVIAVDTEVSRRLANGSSLILLNFIRSSIKFHLVYNNHPFQISTFPFSSLSTALPIKIYNQAAALPKTPYEHSKVIRSLIKYEFPG